MAEAAALSLVPASMLGPESGCADPCDVGQLEKRQVAA